MGDIKKKIIPRGCAINEATVVVLITGWQDE